MLQRRFPPAARVIMAIAMAAVLVVPPVGAFAPLPAPRGGVAFDPFDAPDAPPQVRPADPIDPLLREEIAAAGPGEDLTVIIQFLNPIERSERDLLDRLGLDRAREFHVIPAIAARGPPAAILALAEDPRVLWIEYNEQMIHFMDESTTTINATKVWNTRIEDLLGREHLPIDGSGVTAVVLDSGVDAGHPDLDYLEKTIMNLKSDGDGTYTEMENTDTSSGHGTHVAGTIAGNGDASAGARRGVAPGARLIGLGTGETFFIINALGALEWTYDHSMPHNNPYNIRVVSNSWGTSSAYDPNDAINQVSRRLVYDNQVMVVFAAGNAGGTGSDVQTNPYSLEPGSISVAAIERDGNGVAGFSSRGAQADNFTWPDIGAPGVHIWATEARKTLITAFTKDNADERRDGYYMAISGTSMATPHVSGLVCLMYQAAPSLRISGIHDDFSGNQDIPDYWNNSETRISEVELIMKLSARYLNYTADGDVPNNNTTGVAGRPYDFDEGYGLVRADHAVALALTLEELRQENRMATVWDAVETYEDTMVMNRTMRPSNILRTGWFGDWSRLNDGGEAIFTSSMHDVFVPNGTDIVKLDLNYNPSSNQNGWQVGEITLTVDTNGDGNSDWSGGNAFSARGAKSWEMPASQIGPTGTNWTFEVEGQAVKAQRPGPNIIEPGNNEFNEVMFEYTVGMEISLTFPENGTLAVPDIDLHAENAQWNWADPAMPANITNVTTPANGTGVVEMQTFWYNMSNAYPPPSVVPPRPGAPFPWWMLGAVLLVAVAAVVAIMAARHRWDKKVLGGAAAGAVGGLRQAAGRLPKVRIPPFRRSGPGGSRSPTVPAPAEGKGDGA